MNRLPPPPRFLAALGVFVLVAAGAGTVVGFADADAGPGGAFHLAPPWVGDRGEYAVLAPAAPGTAQPPGSAAPAPGGGYVFEWLPNRTVRDGAGEVAWASPLRLHGTDAANATAEGTARDETLFLAPGGTTALAVADTTVANATASLLPVQDVDSSIRFGPFAGLLPCGLLAPLQGRDVHPGDAPAGPPQACRLGPGGPGVAGLLWRPLALRGQAGHRYLLAEAAGWRAGSGAPLLLQAWFREDIPDPVEVRDATDPAAPVELARLVAFQRGKPSAPADPGAAGPAPPLDMRPRLPWGPDEVNSYASLPLSLAFRLARDDPDTHAVRDFLAAHPGAYVAAADPGDARRLGNLAGGDYGSWSLADTDGGTWSFVLTDGAQQLPVRVEFTPYYAEVLLFADGPSYDDHAYRVATGPVTDAAGLYPLPTGLPAALPTVASMWGQWQAYAPDAIPDAWGFAIGCAPAAPPAPANCGNSTYTVTAGSVLWLPSYGGRHGPVDAAAVNRTLPLSLLEWTGGPGPAAPRATAFRQVRETLDGDAVLAMVAPPPVAPDGVPPAPAWMVPSARQSAALGVGALLAALLYLLRPLIRPSLLDLRTRLRAGALEASPVRQAILRAVRAAPGIHHQALVRAVRRSNGTVQHHVHKLVAAGRLVRATHPGFTCYFLAGADPLLMRTAPVLKSAVARDLLVLLAAEPGLSPTEAARRIGVAPATIHYHARRLEWAGLVRRPARPPAP